MTTYIDPAVVISIHAAQEGCDVKAQSYLQFLSVFQSTQPKRAATLLPVHGVLTIIFQSTQPKRAATNDIAEYDSSPNNFNPRSPRGLRPAVLISCIVFIIKFQSTQPKRAATEVNEFYKKLDKISIHAAQEGCDLTWYNKLHSDSAISIHAAQEGCDYTQAGTCRKVFDISIHAAQEGCDAGRTSILYVPIYFNPRSPRGLRHNDPQTMPEEWNFNPRSPRGLRPVACEDYREDNGFQSTQPKRAATRLLRHCKLTMLFQSTQPKRAAT